MSTPEYWRDVLARIDPLLVPDHYTDCILWGGESSRNGYGRISVLGVKRQVHRVLWELEHGPIPEGMVLDHLCRNRHCVNTAHMELVTMRENTLRGVSPVAMLWRRARGL